MSALCPLALDLREAPVLVVGAGAVAGRRVRVLADFGARPEVVAPVAGPEVAAEVGRGRAVHHPRAYRDGEAAGFRLVFAATDAREVNARVAADARAAGAWVSVADDPRASTFQLPATILRGEVAVSVSTGGASPLLARRLRERLERVVTPGVGRAARRLREIRPRVRSRWPADDRGRREFWHVLINEEFLDAALAGRDEEVDARIEACLSQS